MGVERAEGAERGRLGLADLHAVDLVALGQVDGDGGADGVVRLPVRQTVIFMA